MTLPATLSNTMSLSTVSLTGLPKLWMYVGVMYIHVLVFICTYRGTCVCMHVHEDVWWCPLFSPIAPGLTLWESLTIDLGLRWLTGLASQWTAKIYLSLQPTSALGLQMNASSVNVGDRDLNSSPHDCMVGTLPTSQSQPPVWLLSATIFIQTGLTQFVISFFLGEARIPYRNLSAPMRSWIPGFSL